MSDLGEQAISKVAEATLASQLDAVENLDVDVQANPLQVATGSVDRVSIQGKGLVMQQDLRVEQMQVETEQIAINPLSAAFGKIELTRPTEAEAVVVLTEADINRAFNSEFIQAKLKNQQVTINGQPQTISTQQVDFQLPDEAQIAIHADIAVHETGETQAIGFTAVPTIAASGNAVALEQVKHDQNTSPEYTAALVRAAGELLDLRNFELDGMSFQLKQLSACPGKLTLRAQAAIAQLPAA